MNTNAWSQTTKMKGKNNNNGETNQQHCTTQSERYIFITHLDNKQIYVIYMK